MIEIQNVTKKFGTFTALNSVNFEIPNGAVFGMVGSNGAGKSTLLRTMAGIYKANEGKILFDGKPSFENNAVKSQISFIPDFPYFFRQTSLKDMASFYKNYNPNWSEKRYKELKDLFPIDANNCLQNMSKGMQRQASIILALSTCPKYLFMDEIFDGLDPVIRQLLKRILAAEVIDRNLTVVIASHNLRELEEVCDHVGLLHKGGILFEKQLDSLRLGIHKVQAAYRPMPGSEFFDEFDIITKEIQGSLVTVVARGEKEEIIRKLKGKNPLFIESIPLTLEEVFISEMEAAGYDFSKIIKEQ